SSRLDRIRNHSAHCRALPWIEAGHDENRRCGQFGDRTESLKIRIGNRARDLPREETECAQCRTNGSLVSALNGTASSSIARIRRRSGVNLQGHAADESDEMNSERLHPFFTIGGLVNMPPLSFLKHF